MESYELFAELASGNRLGILHCLKENPMRFSAIAEEIDATSPELSRQLNRLAAAELITKDAEGSYSLTFLGELVTEMVRPLETIAGKAAFFRSHDVSAVPPHLLRDLEKLEGCETVNGVFDLVNMTDRLFGEIEEFAWYLSDSFPHFHLPAVGEKIGNGVNFRVIYPRMLVESLSGELGPKIMHSAGIRILDDIRIVINISDRFGLLALPGRDGNIDRNLTLVGFDEDFRQWCMDVFEYYWERGSVY
jgi:predicted transcriptional regulator